MKEFMKDQADTLRKMMLTHRAARALPGSVVVAYGPTGAGKSSVVAGLAAVLSTMGTPSEVFDAPVLGNELAIKPFGADVLLVNARSGVPEKFIAHHDPAWGALLILAPGTRELAEGYSVAKILYQRSRLEHLGVIVNKVTNREQGKKIFEKFKDVADRFLKVDVQYLGCLLRDEKIMQGVRKQKNLLDLKAGLPGISGGASDFEAIAKKFVSKYGEFALSRFTDEPAPQAPDKAARWVEA